MVTAAVKLFPPCSMSPVPPTPAQLPLVRQTVPVALGNVIVWLTVGSANTNEVVKALSVAPWNTSGVPPSIWLVTVSLSLEALPIMRVSPVGKNGNSHIRIRGRLE